MKHKKILKYIKTVILVLLVVLIIDIGRYAFLPDVAALKEKELTSSFSIFSPYLVNALISGEDNGFLSHNGFDFEAIGRAAKENVRVGELKYGASTITQQLVKNLYLSDSKNVVLKIIRKLKEAILTVRMEKTLSKKRILELYLNLIEWGPEIYGAEAASQYYFKKPVSELTLEESIRLVSTLPNPKIFRPLDDSEYLAQRRKAILYFVCNNHKLPSQDKYDPLYPEFSLEALKFRYPELENWRWPPGPSKIAIQIGHWKNEPLPEELESLKDGSEVGLVKEIDINKQIGEKLRDALIEAGYEVDLLGAIVEPDYHADVFIALHANYLPSQKSGFMIATPAIDYSSSGLALLAIIDEEYQQKTGLKLIVNKKDGNIGYYYSFNWSRFFHSIHPRTPAVIIELGTMNNPEDLEILLNKQDVITRAITEGITRYFNEF